MDFDNQEIQNITQDAFVDLNMDMVHCQGLGICTEYE